MGCTLDNYSVGLEKKEYIDNFLNKFNEILNDYLYSNYSKIEKENCIIKEDLCNKCWICFESEPLFKRAEGAEITEYFIKEYLKKYPNEEITLSYQCTYSNCADAYHVTYIYNPKTKDLFIDERWGEDSGIHECQECEAYFEEALVYLEDYDKNKHYFCPECGEELSLDVTISIKTKNLKDILL